MLNFCPLIEFIRSYISDEEDIDDFGNWAFGQDYRNLRNGSEFLKVWNDLHGQDLRIDSNGSVTTDLPEMIKLWEENQLA